MPTSTSIVGILPLLAAGFIFNRIWLVTNFSLAKADGQRLFFASAISGLTLALFTFPICYYLRGLASGTSIIGISTTWLRNSLPIPHGLTLAATMIAGLGCGYIFNALTWLCKRISDPKSIMLLPQWVYLRVMARNLSPLDHLLKHACEQRKLVAINLKSRKVYCGLILEVPGNWGATSSYLEIFPRFSTFRDKDTLLVNRAQEVTYPAFELVTLQARLKAIHLELVVYRYLRRKSLRKKSQYQPHDSLTHFLLERDSNSSLEEEHLQINAALKRLDPPVDFNVNDWKKIIPFDQVESASIFDEISYEKWFRQGEIAPSTLSDADADLFGMSG